MKKSLLAIYTALALGATAFAQCNPDNSCNSSICPDVNIPEANAGDDYSVFFTVNVPADTSITGPINISGTINYAVINDITGLPDGFTYNCQNSECKTLGGEAGCFELKGSPTDAETGVYKVLINLTINTTSIAGNQDLPLSYEYDLVVNGVTASISEADKSLTAYPNPAANVLTVSTSQKSSLELMDMNGTTVISDDIEDTKQLDVSKLPKGSYLLKVQDATKEVIKKIVIQ